MPTILRSADQTRSPHGTLAYEGKAHGSGVSFYLVNSDPGQRVGLHTHPYAETWIVRGGRAEMRIGPDTIIAEPGDIVVAPAGTPHGFASIGPGKLDIICIHASDTFVQTDLE